VGSGSQRHAHGRDNLHIVPVDLYMGAGGERFDLQFSVSAVILGMHAVEGPGESREKQNRNRYGRDPL
jgi:hypothetical protein